MCRVPLGVFLGWTATHLLQWRHNERGGASTHQPKDCLVNRLSRRTSKKTSKLRIIGLCAWNSPVTSGFPAQKASNVENVSIWWRHHVNIIMWQEHTLSLKLSRTPNIYIMSKQYLQHALAAPLLGIIRKWVVIWRISGRQLLDWMCTLEGKSFIVDNSTVCSGACSG